jgi:hypothetical protein
MDFRYQLTAIGALVPNLYIAEDDDTTATSYYHNKSKSKIAGGTSSMNFSWKVTGICKDLWVNVNCIQVEEVNLRERSARAACKCEQAIPGRLTDAITKDVV